MKVNMRGFLGVRFKKNRSLLDVNEDFLSSDDDKIILSNL
jgi:hypothetical protein